MIIAPDPRIVLPKTGQATSYRNGDDGQVLAGCPILLGAAPGSKFETIPSASANLVIDHATSLMWVRAVPKIKPSGTGQETLSAQSTWSAAHGTYYINDLVVGDGTPDALYYICIVQHTAAADKEPPNGTYWIVTPWTASATNLTTPAQMTWNNAIDNSVALTYGGFGPWTTTYPHGWRAPNTRELLSICQATGSSPFVDGTIFPNTQTALYWSATTDPANTLNALAVAMNECMKAYSIVKTSAVRYIRPVRSLADWEKS